MSSLSWNHSLSFHVSLTADLIPCNLWPSRGKKTAGSTWTAQRSFVKVKSDLLIRELHTVFLLSFVGIWGLGCAQRNKGPGPSVFLPMFRPPGEKIKRSLFSCLPCTCLKTTAWVTTSFWRVNHVLECNDPGRKQDLKTRKFRQRDRPRLAINHGASGMRSRTYSVCLNHPFSQSYQDLFFCVTLW